MASSTRRLLALALLATVATVAWAASTSGEVAAAMPQQAAPTTSVQLRSTTTKAKATTTVATTAAPTVVTTTNASTTSVATTTVAPATTATTATAAGSGVPVTTPATSVVHTKATGGRATATINRIVGVLALLGFGLIGLVIWYWRSTRPIVPYLEGLDLMATPKWRRANPLRREMMLEVLRLRRGLTSVEPIAAESHAPVVRVGGGEAPSAPVAAAVHGSPAVPVPPALPLAAGSGQADASAGGRPQVVLAPPDQDPLPPPAVPWPVDAPAPGRISPIRVEPIAQRFGIEPDDGLGPARAEAD